MIPSRKNTVALVLFGVVVLVANAGDAVAWIKEYRGDRAFQRADHAFLRKASENEAIRAAEDVRRARSPRPMPPERITGVLPPVRTSEPTTATVPANVNSPSRLTIGERYHTVRGYIYCHTQALFEQAYSFRAADDRQALRSMLDGERCWITDDGKEVILEGRGAGSQYGIVRYRHFGDEFSLFTQIEALR